MYTIRVEEKNGSIIDFRCIVHYVVEDNVLILTHLNYELTEISAVNISWSVKEETIIDSIHAMVESEIINKCFNYEGIELIMELEKLYIELTNISNDVYNEVDKLVEKLQIEEY